MNPGGQEQFDFGHQPARTGPDGLDLWHRQRDRAAHRLARRLGLPLGHEVEVWLHNGMRLRGRLLLRDQMLLLDAIDQHDLELLIGKVNFRYPEMESCVRLD